jgi:hypothetical protein
MKKKIKPFLLLALVAVFCVLVIIPTQVDASGFEMPGYWTDGKYGLTCACPRLIWSNCGCRIILDP